MSSPATPTGTRRRTLLNQSQSGVGDSGSLGGSSWLGHLSGIVGDMLQGWGLLGALKGRGNTTKVTSSWNSFGGIGGGLGSSSLSRSGAYGSTPGSPLVHSSRQTEAIELMPMQPKEGEVRVVMRRARSCPRHQGRATRHSYHEGSAPSSYLLTAVLMHSLKQSSNEQCDTSCHICNNVPYEQLEAVLAKEKSLSTNKESKANNRFSCLSPVPSVGTEGERTESSRHSSFSSHRSSVSCRNSSASTKFYDPDSSMSSCRPESSNSFYTANEGTLTESLPAGSSWTDGPTDSYYPADSLTEGRETDDDDTLCEGNDSDLEVCDTIDSENIKSAEKRERISSLGKKVGAMKLRPRQTFSEAWKGGKRPKFRTLNSHDGSVNNGARCNSMTSLTSMNLLHNPRLLGGFTANEKSCEGPMMLWPLRRSLSTSPTHSFFSWEENPCYLRIEGLGVRGSGHTWSETKNFSPSPYWCDTCAHLIFTSPLTCTDCSYTCHKQCQPLVAIDCRGRTSSTSSEEKKKSSGDELEVSVPGECNDVLLADKLEKDTLNADQSGGESDSDSSDYATLGPESTFRSDVCLNTQELQSHILRSLSVESDSKEGEEKHEGEHQEKDMVTAESTSLRRAIANINLSESSVAADTLEEWVLDSAASQGLQLAKECDGGYRGCLRVHLNLTRPINIVAGTRPPSIYDILQEDRTLDKTLTSFYMPRNAVKAIHIDSSTTTRQVIVALLRKFKVVDNPQKFALYERSFDQQQTKGRLRRLSDSECPLELAMSWSKEESELCHRIVLQENDTNDIQWDAFSLPELNNFLRILDREELDYRSQIEEKYQRLREQLERHLEKCG